MMTLEMLSEEGPANVFVGGVGDDNVDTKEVGDNGNVAEGGVVGCGFVVGPDRSPGRLPGDNVAGTEEMTGVISGVLVTRVLN